MSLPFDGLLIQASISLPVATARSDAHHCARLARAHARTFSLASRFLPREKRRATFALYAFCRVVDDIVDRADTTADNAPADEVARYRKELDAALDGRPDGPVFRELARAVRRFDVPHDPLYALIAGVERDLVPVRYADWHALDAYCRGVASTVGEMCTHVFGVRGGAEAQALALAHARTLGVAMQLTNILRDVGEDARRGRCYLPDDELAHFGIDREEVFAAAGAVDGGTGTQDARWPLHTTGRWRAFMRFQMARAHRLYAEAYSGVALLSVDARRSAAACALGYARLLAAIERQHFDTLTARAQLTRAERALILWRSWRWSVARPDPAAVPNGGVRRVAGEFLEPA